MSFHSFKLFVISFYPMFLDFSSVNAPSLSVEGSSSVSTNKYFPSLIDESNSSANNKISFLSILNRLEQRVN